MKIKKIKEEIRIDLYGIKEELTNELSFIGLIVFSPFIILFMLLRIALILVNNILFKT